VGFPSAHNTRIKFTEVLVVVHSRFYATLLKLSISVNGLLHKYC